ncbi:hypothetical protein DNTS_015701 [Danionella cerebrum]|uniref:FGF n=1 Tax=Danionella cerebrum TaxID=2873325 RepID=A0A553QCX9_9TELE|nr:hypothetical protein DNTS_015701 [Danionella translucida]
MLLASFFILFQLFASLGWCLYVPAQNVLLLFESQVRERLLYTENRTHGLFLQMNSDGTVTGSTIETQYCVLELLSVKSGQTVIKSKARSLYLCVNEQNNLRGQVEYSAKDCTFQELLLEDGYSFFLSPHNKLPLSLLEHSQRHRAPLSYFRFLPVQNTVSGRVEELDPSSHHQDLNLDSDDPEGMSSRIQSIFSPSLHSRK